MLDFNEIQKTFLSGPGHDLVPKLMAQMALVPGFQKLFGPIGAQGSWADYPRFDWPLTSLPAINIFEASSETKDSDHAYLRGTVQIQVYWPAEFRREDTRRVPLAFKGALQNFFNSCFVGDMLDELVSIQRPAKVYGLNEFGKTLTWSPNTEGVMQGEAVPVTILDVQYRIDLRGWERALEYQGRTECDPFNVSLADLDKALGGIEALDDNGEVKIVLPVEVTFDEEN